MTRRRDILASWADTRLAMRMDVEALARRRTRLWEAMRPVLAATPALSRHAGADLRDIPIVEPAAMRADPAGWNSAGIGAEEALAAGLDAEAGGRGLVRPGIAAGLSTGTSGTRGLFLASAHERARYVGQSIARLLPAHSLLTGARIALVLRADSELYRDVGGGRFAFQHLPLGLPDKTMLDALRRFGPTVLIAPPRELAAIARCGQSPLPSLRRLFWGGEPMAAREREWIGGRIGLRPDPIYQATEGFIGAACARGRLHLNDDSMDIELEEVAGIDAFRPVVTDLRRHIQPVVRVRLDDIVQPDGGACGCGFAGRLIRPVAGRVGDIWRTTSGTMTPELVEDYIAGAVGPEASWRVRGSPGAALVELVDPRHGPALRVAVEQLLGPAAIRVDTVSGIAGPKRRRVTWAGAL